MKGLDAFIDSRRAVAFAWGTSDCAGLAGDWKLASTGHDPLADLRGTGLQPLERMRTVQRAGGFIQAGNARLGPCLPGAFARRGDIVLVRTGHRGTRAAHRAFGVCIGAYVAAQGLQGLVFLPLMDVEAAWRI